jgi:hypothetical protein
MENIQDIQRWISETQRWIGETQKWVGEINGFSKIWLNERQEINQSLHNLSSRISHLETSVSNTIAFAKAIETINGKIEKLEATRNRALGVASMMAIISGMIGAFIQKYWDSSR